MNFSKVKFCYSAWIYSQVLPSGQLSFCCFANSKRIDYKQGQPITIQKLPSINSVLNSEKGKKIRAALLNGEFPSECSGCNNIENCGSISPRMAMNSGLAPYINQEELIKETKADGELENPQLSYLELRLGNLCNLKCRFCGPHNSQSWYSEYSYLTGSSSFFEEGTKIDLTDRKLFQWPSMPDSVGWILSNSQNLVNLQFSGGEPLISKEHFAILDGIISQGRAKAINLIYTTNGTVIPEGLFERWRKFKTLILFVSIEGTDKIFEYQRWPAKWDSVRRNISLFTEEVGKSITKLCLQPMINVYNIANISQLAKWYLTQDARLDWVKHVNMLTEPEWQSAFILEATQKRIVIEKLDLEIAEMERVFGSSERVKIILYWLRSLKELLLSRDWSHLKNEFRQRNRELDDLRKIEMKNYLDEMSIGFLC